MGNLEQSGTILENLPDEVLVQILSLLTVDEAARTCVLSHRWENLWRSIPRLIFVAPKNAWRSYTSNFRYVERVMSLHECPFLDEFRIKFEMCICSGTICDVDRIIKLLIPKRVKTIEIHLAYTCDYDLSNLSIINSLTSLTLKGWSISGSILEYLISASPHLELLCVSQSNNIVNLKVAGPSVQLKQLQISGCWSIQSIELFAPKLVTFNYSGKRIVFRVGENPNLSHLIFEGGDEEQISYFLGMFSSLRSQLVTLRFHIRFCGDKEIPQFLELINLKTLILDISAAYVSLIGLTSLIEAAPSLKNFTLKLSSNSSAKIEEPKPLFRPLKCLKKVVIFGFSGGCAELELVRHLLANAINVEKIVLDPFHDRHGNSKPQTTGEQKKAERRRQRAHELKRFVPPGAELVVL